MSRRFRERANDREVYFGDPWKQAVGSALEGCDRVAIITSPRRADVGDELEEELGSRGAAVVALARQHVPEEIVAEAVREVMRVDADALVTFGGGSAVGLGKAVKLELGGGPRLVCVPTTFAGSEMTDIYGIRRGDHKDVGRDENCRPDSVIYDPSLFVSLPAKVAVPSLFNALAHAVDALYPSSTTDEIRALAAESISVLAGAVLELDNLESWSRALFGAYRAATILGRAGMALHHKLAHVVAGSLDLPHAPTHTALLPHVVAFNSGANASADNVLRQALASDDQAGAIFDLAESAGAEMRLSELGLARAGIADCADAAAAAQTNNPRQPQAEELVSLLDDARLGRRPSVGRRLDSPATGKPPHAGLRPLSRGADPQQAALGVVVVHGRGSTAERVLDLLAPTLDGFDDAAIVACQADERRWYPRGFSGPVEDNQPGLDSALAVIDGIIRRLVSRGLRRESIAIIGFSQGACLALDYLARSGQGLGGVCAIAGGLIGDDAPAPRHSANLEGVRVVTGVAERDEWVPLLAVKRARAHLIGLGATVVAVDHVGSAHTVTDEQHRAMKDLLRQVRKA